MTSLNLRSAGNMLIIISILMLVTGMVELTLADPLIKLINPVSSSNLVDQFPAGYYSVPVIDDKGNAHEMIISTVSLDTWFATTTTTCPGTPNPDPACGWNTNALYDPTGVATNETLCSIGVKPLAHPYTECYSIMPNRSITIGANTAQEPDLQLYANVGLLINSTWDGSAQSGMLGLAGTVDCGCGGPWNSILDDMAARYGQTRQFTLAFSLSADTGGWLTFGDALPPNALPLDNPAVFQTPMEHATINNRVDDLYVVTASIQVVTAPLVTVQYVIDSGDVYLRVPSATAQLINSAWNPAGTPMNDGTGRWSLPCNAAAPAIGFTVGGQTFDIDEAAMLRNENNECWSTIIDWQDGPYILGWPLLTSVMVTFDLHNHTLYFQESLAASGPAGPGTSQSSVQPSSPAGSPTSAPASTAAGSSSSVEASIPAASSTSAQVSSPAGSPPSVPASTAAGSSPSVEASISAASSTSALASNSAASSTTAQVSTPAGSPPSVPSSTPPSVPSSTPPSVPSSTPPSVPSSTPPSVPSSTPPSVPSSTPPSVPSSTPAASSSSAQPSTLVISPSSASASTSSTASAAVSPSSSTPSTASANTSPAPSPSPSPGSQSAGGGGGGGAGFTTTTTTFSTEEVSIFEAATTTTAAPTA